jgi:hypothetical protein
MISSTDRGTKLTTLPVSVPSWRTDFAVLGIWFVQIEALTHSARRAVTTSSPIWSWVDEDDAVSDDTDTDGATVNALEEVMKADAINTDRDVVFMLKDSVCCELNM